MRFIGGFKRPAVATSWEPYSRRRRQLSAVADPGEGGGVAQETPPPSQLIL